MTPWSGGRDVDLDRIAGAEVALLDDLQVGARARGQGEALEEGRVAHLQAELEAGQPRLDDLEQRGADPPALAEDGAGDIDALR